MTIVAIVVNGRCAQSLFDTGPFGLSSTVSIHVRSLCMNKLLAALFAAALGLTSISALAADTAKTDRAEQKAERQEMKGEQKAEKAQSKADRKAEKHESKADKAAARGKEAKAEKQEMKAEKAEEKGDAKAAKAEAKADRKAAKTREKAY
jgi:hypothetical protein